MTDHPQAVLVVNEHIDFVASRLSPKYSVYKAWESVSTVDQASVKALVVAGEAPFDRSLISQFPNTGLIACLTSGYDGIDVVWAASRGIDVTHAVGVNHDDVADHAVGLMIAWERGLVVGNQAVLSGEWSAERKTLTRSIDGLRIGIVGMGAIGKAIATRCAAFNLQIEWWGPNPKPNVDLSRRETLRDLATASDVLFVCSRAEETNRHLISDEVQNALGPKGLLINVARGSLVDEHALIQNLKSGKLGGAALDVFESEPTDPCRWRDVPNVILTPHTGGATLRAVSRMVEQLELNLDAFFAGTELVTPVMLQ
jgi:lactate dehydrogenase-like 2-hydroxyacid dehydrogenase